MRRSGFSLVEILTVVFIIAVIAGTIISRLFVQQQGIEFREAVQKIESSANQARRLAASSGRAATLDYDTQAQALTISQNNEDDQEGTGDTNTPEPTSNALTGDGWQLDEVRLPDDTTDTELNIVFQPDGTATAKTARFSYNGSEVSLRVSSNGKIEVTRGELEEGNTEEEWEAGNIEQRSGG